MAIDKSQLKRLAMQPLGDDFARILDENRWALYGDTEATPNASLSGLPLKEE